MSRILGALALLGLLALPPGGRLFGGVVVAVAAATLVEMSRLLARSGARPVLAAAAIAGVVLPATAVVQRAGAWQRVPGYTAATLLAACALVLAFGRRSGVTAALGATAAASLFTGLGATALVMLRGTRGGFRWTLVLVGIVAVVAAAEALRPRLAGAGGALAPVASLLVAGVLAAVAAVALAPPLTPLRAAVLLVLGYAGAWAGATLASALASAGRGPARGAGASTVAVLSPVIGVLLAAPAAYLLARAVQS